MHAPGQTNDYQQRKEVLIDNNYWSVYERLLPDEGPNPPARQPIEIGNKDVYALSDIEGYNIDFLEMLSKLGLVEYSEQQPADTNGWESCLSMKKNQPGEFPVYYKFNKEACRNFNDVIVLCGDYVRNDRDVSEGLVRILEELRVLLNGGKTEENKGLYLLAGNHDIADYDNNESSQRDLKRRVLNLRLYTQLMLMNGDGKKLLFQHTNFPYREQDNYIVNKKIDPQKASKFLDNSYTFMTNPQYKSQIPILGHDGFFHLRYMAKEGAKQPNYYGCNDVFHESPLPRELYSDFGIGYDAKFIGHDAQFYGCSMRPDGRGDVYNVNICNQNKPSFVCWRSNKKQRTLQSNVQSSDKKIGNIYMRNNYDAIQNKEYKKCLYNLLYNKLLKENNR